MPYRRVVIGSKEGSAVDGLNLENLWVFSLRTSATLQLQRTILLGWVPLELRPKSDDTVLKLSALFALADFRVQIRVKPLELSRR